MLLLEKKGQADTPSEAPSEILVAAAQNPVILELEREQECYRQAPSPTLLSRKGEMKPKEEEGHPEASQRVKGRAETRIQTS